MLKKFISLLLILSLLNTTNIFAAVTPSLEYPYYKVSKTLESSTLDSEEYLITVTWDTPVASLGTWLGDEFESNIGKASGMRCKRIKYIDINHNIQYANPYQPGSFTTIKGQSITLEMIADVYRYDGGPTLRAWVCWYDNIHTGYNLSKYSDTYYELLTSAYTPERNGTLLKQKDDTLTNWRGYDTDGNVNGWAVNYKW